MHVTFYQHQVISIVNHFPETIIINLWNSNTHLSLNCPILFYLCYSFTCPSFLAFWFNTTCEWEDYVYTKLMVIEVSEPPSKLVAQHPSASSCVCCHHHVQRTTISGDSPCTMTNVQRFLCLVGVVFCMSRQLCICHKQPCPAIHHHNRPRHGKHWIGSVKEKENSGLIKIEDVAAHMGVCSIACLWVFVYSISLGSLYA